MNRRKFLQVTSSGIISLPFFNFKLKAGEEGLKWKKFDCNTKLPQDEMYLIALGNNNYYRWVKNIRNARLQDIDLNTSTLLLEDMKVSKKHIYMESCPLGYWKFPDNFGLKLEDSPYLKFLKNHVPHITNAEVYYIKAKDIVKENFNKWDDNKVPTKLPIVSKKPADEYRCAYYSVIKYCYNKNIGPYGLSKKGICLLSKGYEGHKYDHVVNSGKSREWRNNNLEWMYLPKLPGKNYE